MSQARGLLDVGDFALGRLLQSRVALFQRELQRVPADRFVPLTEPPVSSGAWVVFPLVLRWATIPGPLDPEPGQALCPESHRILAADERVLGSGFSRLLPGTRIPTHEDRPRSGVLRFHLCLDGADDSLLEVDGEPVVMTAGRGIVFDHSLPHAARHDGPAARTALIVDFRPTQAEASQLRRQRGDVNLGPVSESTDSRPYQP